MLTDRQQLQSSQEVRKKQDFVRTGGEEDVFVALVLGAGADEKLRAHARHLFHLALAVVVILQGQAVQPLSRVVAHRIKGGVVGRLPPCREGEQT